QHLHGGKPWRADLDGKIFDACRRSLRAAFGREPVITGEGGSIPVVGDFARVLKAPVLLVGFGLPGENAHARDGDAAGGVFALAEELRAHRSSVRLIDRKFHSSLFKASSKLKALKSEL